ncbi:hypothetical protein H072_7562 [Dactylellina haptotyla CBS 200.50]|uniref:Rhodopsin domain-containing protein n=1 Tax=Dactylellina haptotyla (strain CBS 200.50) TaxID=1284197 RepID=S8BTW9_DACHA|nr:hypothetical protein H072_7562 [Dactylellina haptotyla CBS 200.50]
MADSDEGLGKGDIELILLYSLAIGSESPFYSNLRILDVISKYSDFITANGNFTPADLTQNFGTSPSISSLLIEYLGGADYISYLVPQIIGAENDGLLPHPRTTTIVVPLFVTFTAISTVAVALRLWSRHRVAGGIKTDDWVTVLGYFLTIMWGAVAIHHSNANGEYQAFWDLSWTSLRETYRTYFALTALYPWVMMVIKISLLIFYYAVTNINYMRWAVWAIGFITVGNTLAGFFITVLACRPINYWDHLLENPCKINRGTANVCIAAIYMFTDIAIWVLPMPLVWRLKLPVRERILAVITFGVGAVACIASGFRIKALLDFESYDAQSSSSLLISAWTITELNLALICASAPAIRALFKFFAPKIRTTVTGTISTMQSAIGDKEKLSEEKAGEKVDSASS